MKKILLIITLLCSSMGMVADDVVDSINNIKKNHAYLYGEATMESEKSAEAQAKTDLALKIQEWVFGYTNKLVDDDIDSRIAPYVKTLSTRRADKIRVFAYVEKYDVLPLLRDMGINFKDSTAVRIESPKAAVSKETFGEVLTELFANGQKPKTRNEVLERIKKARDFFELRKVMKSLIDQGAITGYGKRETCKQPESCYWVVYDRAGNIKAILGKGETTRKNYKTNSNDSLANYEGKGYAGIWFQIAENKKTTKI